MNRHDIIPIAAITVGVVLGAMRWLQRETVPVVLPVDFGILLAARTEAQRAADGGALSGALSLWEAKNDVDRARIKAIEYANASMLHGDDVLIEDVSVRGDEGCRAILCCDDSGCVSRDRLNLGSTP